MNTNNHTQNTKPPRNFGRALQLALQRAELTQQELGTACAMTQSVVARYISGQRRPEPDQLSAISHSAVWAPRPRAGIQIMLGHLQDELERAGWPPLAVLMRARGDRRRPLRALHEIEQAIARGDDDISALVQHIADLLRRADMTTETQQAPDMLKVAEPPAPEYGDPHNSRLSNSKK